MFKKIALSRREFIKSHIADDSEILELGPFNNPTFRRPDENVKYMDLFSRAELAEMHGSNSTRPADEIVETDFVVKKIDFAQEINHRFDLIAAHHVIEHIADLVFWFKECEKLLNAKGLLFLSIPDRRYTFDYFRPISLGSQIVRAAQEHPLKPTYWQVVEHFYYHYKVDVLELWKGNSPSKFVPRFSLKEAMDRAFARKDVYTDTHCWVFTPESFAQCIDDLRSASAIQFTLKETQDTLQGSNEFRVILQKD